MDFKHTEERQLLIDALSRYLRDNYSLSARLDAGASASGFNHDKWMGLRELGAVAALFDAEVGGCGGTGFDLMAVFELVGRSLVVEPLLPIAMVASCFANEPDRAGQILLGEQIVVPAFEESGNRYQAVEIETVATKSAHGWRLSGEKTGVPFINSAHQLLVSARTAGTRGDREGLSLFLIPTSMLARQAEACHLLDGGVAGTLALEDVLVSDDALIGAPGEAIEAIDRAEATGIVALGAEALGIMEVLKDAVVEHLQTRQQFGQPLGKFQSLRHRLATCLIEIEQARSSVINAAARLEADSLHRRMASAAAKYTIGTVGTLVAEQAIQLHGGMGMSWELPVAHYAKRLVMIGHQLGDEDYHLARYIALDACGADATLQSPVA